jgi:hypothetical protein
MHFVDEQDDLTLRPGGLGQDGLEPLLELSPVFGAGDQGPHVERHQPLVLQAFRHVAIDDAQGQALDDSGLAHPRLADEDRIVLGAARQHLDRAADLLVATDDGIQPPVPRRLSQIPGVALQRLVAFLGRGAVGRATLADSGDGGIQLCGRRAGLLQRVRRRPAVARQGQQQPLGGDEGVAGGLGRILRHREDAREIGLHIELAASALDLGQLGERRIDLFDGLIGMAAGLLYQTSGQAGFVWTVALVQQRFKQMLGRELLMAARQGELLGGVDRLFGAVGIDVSVHGVWSSPVGGTRGRPR